MFRLGLAVVALPVTANSIWAIVAPKHWFNNFGLNSPWVGALGSYNEHLVLDFSLAHLSLSLLLLVTVFWLSKWLVRLSLSLWLLYAIPHFIFHGFHHAPFGTADNTFILGSLGLQVLLPLVLLFASGRLDPSKSYDFSRDETEAKLNFRGLPPASGLSVSALSWMTKQQFGQPLETLKLVGHHPWLLFGISMMETAVDQFDSLSERLHSLIALRVAQIVGCPW